MKNSITRTVTIRDDQCFVRGANIAKSYLETRLRVVLPPRYRVTYTLDHRGQHRVCCLFGMGIERVRGKRFARVCFLPWEWLGMRVSRTMEVQQYDTDL